MPSRPTVLAMIAPRAGPNTNAAQAAPSIYPLIRARRSGSSVKNGPKEEMAVNTGVPTRPRRKVATTNAGRVSAKTIPNATGMNTISAAMRTRRGSKRSTNTPATAEPIREATPRAAMTAATPAAVASNSNAALPQMPTKKAASPPLREMNRARTTRRTSRSAHMTSDGTRGLWRPFLHFLVGSL